MWLALTQHEGVQFFLTTLLPIWLCGLLSGLVFPRQGLQQSLGALFLSGAGTVSVGGRSAALSQIMMFINGVMFIQSVWYRFTPPGTAHDLCSRAAALLRLHRVPGIRRLVAGYNKGDLGSHKSASGALNDKQLPQQHDSLAGQRAWPVDESDLDFFKSRVSQSKVPLAGPWETMIQKEIPGALKYHSQRRMLNDIKKTEYMTTSLTVDSRPREVMDFFLSDAARQRWDNLLTKAEILENGEFSHREMIVHWVRSFPFSFLSDRDYVIGRREFQEGDTIYGITKVVKRPEHSPGKLVQTDNYWSMWSCEPISCPYNTGKPATKTVLLHMEDFKIPENLSRFAVKHGMWGFIKNMTPHMQQFIKDRRERGLSPDEPDPHAFGAPSNESTIARTVSPVQFKDLRKRPGSAAGHRLGCTTPPPPRRSCSEGALSASSHSSRSKMRRVASAAIAGGMLIALGAAQRTESQANLSRATSVRASKRGSEDDEDELGTAAK